MNKTKIIIAGIGGVGGYFGGLLAHHWEDDQAVEIHFLARGEHLKQIKAQGLKVIKGDESFVARPTSATDNPADIGKVDFVIVCTKTYDLESVIEQLRPNIDDQTIVLPLLNGVNNQAVIQNLLPNNLVLQGCVYIVSRLKQAGMVENSGNIQKLFFGLDGYADKRLDWLEKLLKAASIEAHYSATISTVIWEKFIFLSSIATATAYYDQSIGPLLAEPIHRQTLMSLIEEVIQLAKAKGVVIAPDIKEKTSSFLEGLPFDTTSSMHSDFQAKKHKNELETLTAYVVKEGRKHKIETASYHIAYQRLSQNQSQIT
ncbi:MAG: ketopantoate reductase family protein [Bacteroidia bacterium]